MKSDVPGKTRQWTEAECHPYLQRKVIKIRYYRRCRRSSLFVNLAFSLRTSMVSSKLRLRGGGMTTDATMSSIVLILIGEGSLFSQISSVTREIVL